MYMAQGGQQQSKKASKISRSQDFIEISGFQDFTDIKFSHIFQDLTEISQDLSEILKDLTQISRNKILLGILDLRFQHLHPRFHPVADPLTWPELKHITYTFNLTVTVFLFVLMSLSEFRVVCLKLKYPTVIL